MEARLLRVLKYVEDKSRFYQLKYGDNLKKIKDFTQLPFTTKAELLDDQKNNPPFGSNLCASAGKIKRIHKTSGTTLNPLIVVMTNNDIRETVKIGKKCFQLAGLKKNDIVIHCLSYNMWMGGYTDHQSLEATGAGVIPFGVGNTQNLINTILTIGPTAIHCTPSYLAKIETVLSNEYNLKPGELGLKLGLFGAESGLQNSSFRNNIEGKWGIIAMNANYGMADVLSMFGAECYRQAGLHFMGEDVLYPELINPVTLEVIPIETGSIGELVLTNLSREAQPVIRYRTSDIIKILTTEKCSCGCDNFKFEIIGRSDDMFVVKGVNVSVNSVDSVIANYLDFLSGVIQIHINKEPPVDRVQLFVEIKNGQDLISEAGQSEIKEKILRDFKSRMSISPEIEFLSFGVLPRTEGKTKKLFKTL